MYELFEHTADLGLRMRAPDLEALFAEAGRALLAALVDDPATVRPERGIAIELQTDDRDFLLFDWLKELLFQFDSEHLLLSRFEVRLRGDRLQGQAWGEAFDPARHALAHEVKAITYHGLRVEPSGDGWLAEVIVDI